MGSTATSIPRAWWHGEGRGDRHAVLTHAGVPVPVEVVAGPAGAAVAADAVLAAVLARRGQALVCIWGGQGLRASSPGWPPLAPCPVPWPPRTLAAVAVGGELHAGAAFADEAALGVDAETLAGSAQALVDV